MKPRGLSQITQWAKRIGHIRTLVFWCSALASLSHQVQRALCLTMECWKGHGSHVWGLFPPAPRASGTHLLPSLLSMNSRQKLKVGHDGKLANAANQDFPSPSPRELIITNHGLGHIQSGLPGPKADLLVECDICFLVFKDFQGIAMKCEHSRKLPRWCHLGKTDLNAGRASW